MNRNWRGDKIDEDLGYVTEDEMEKLVKKYRVTLDFIKWMFQTGGLSRVWPATPLSLVAEFDKSR